jgi:hypothetical protein
MQSVQRAPVEFFVAADNSAPKERKSAIPTFPPPLSLSPFPPFSVHLSFFVFFSLFFFFFFENFRDRRRPAIELGRKRRRAGGGGRGGDGMGMGEDEESESIGEQTPAVC